MAVMGTVVGISDDLQRVSIELLQDGKPLGWIEFTPEEIDNFVKNLEKFKGLVRIDKAGLKHAV